MGQRITRSRPGVYLLRYVWTPVDRLVVRLTGGRRNIAPRALPGLVLRTTGRRTGRRHASPVLYLEDEGRYVVVASNYGRPSHPGWSFNLIAEPNAEIQIGTRRQAVVARRATAEEYERWWPRLVAIWPGWRTYRRLTDREFRMFVLQPR